MASKSVGQKELLSVTVVKKHGLSDDALKRRVQEELQKYCGADSYRFIKHYAIAQALPKLKGLQYEQLPSESRLVSGVFLAGDTQLNGSLNAAMISGESGGLAVLQALEAI